MSVAAQDMPAGRGWLGLVPARAMRFLMRDTNIVIGTVIASNVLRMVSSVVLTRLLMPAAFGTVGLIGSISFVLSMISDLGFQAFVIRHRDGAEARFLDVIWTIRLVRAAALTVILLLLARPIAELVGTPTIAPALAVSALQFLIDGGSSLSVVTALRERQLVRLSALDIIGSIVQLIVAIVLAVAWHSYWSIVVAMLVSSVARTALSYTMFPNARRRLAVDPGYARELWRFARFVTGSSIINMVMMQSDKLVLARLLPLDTLGLYILAGNLALAPMAFTVNYANRVLYPLYARTWREDPAQLRDVFYGARRAVSILYMIGVGGLIGAAPVLVGLLYDARYGHAALYLRLLALTPLLALATYSASEVLTASGRVHVPFHANIARLVWLGVFGPLCWMYAGPIGLIACVGGLELPTLLYSWWQLHRFGLLRLGEELVMLVLGGVGAAVGYAICGLAGA
jgi:lipopolysaccharide exporter